MISLKTSSRVLKQNKCHLLAKHFEGLLWFSKECFKSLIKMGSGWKTLGAEWFCLIKWKHVYFLGADLEKEEAKRNSITSEQEPRKTCGQWEGPKTSIPSPLWIQNL